MSHNGLHVQFKENIYCIYVPYYMYKSFRMGKKNRKDELYFSAILIAFIDRLYKISGYLMPMFLYI